jgi:hypothetical protein
VKKTEAPYAQELAAFNRGGTDTMEAGRSNFSDQSNNGLSLRGSFAAIADCRSGFVECFAS